MGNDDTECECLQRKKKECTFYWVIRTIKGFMELLRVY
jgi:hypothetical protein